MQTALITGATDGIGKAFAQKLLSEGWEVVIMSRSPQKCADTVNELQRSTGNTRISAIPVDLSLLRQTASAVDRFLETHQQLDLLVLNANAIANERILTVEGHEQNFALGYLARALMVRKLESTLKQTPGSHILSVIGMDTLRPDFDDLTIEKGFTGRKGLTRWQWAVNVFTHYYAKHGQVPINLYMPGLVKTKILSNEPQPMRAFVKLMNLIIGLPPEKAAENMFRVINDIAGARKNDALYSWSKERAHLKLDTQPGDTERLLEITNAVLQDYL